MFNLNALITLTVFNLIALVQIAANVLVPTKLQRGPVLAAASICLATSLTGLAMALLVPSPIVGIASVTIAALVNLLAVLSTGLDHVSDRDSTQAMRALRGLARIAVVGAPYEAAVAGMPGRSRWGAASDIFVKRRSLWAAPSARSAQDTSQTTTTRISADPLPKLLAAASRSAQAVRKVSRPLRTTPPTPASAQSLTPRQNFIVPHRPNRLPTSSLAFLLNVNPGQEPDIFADSRARMREQSAPPHRVSLVSQDPRRPSLLSQSSSVWPTTFSEPDPVWKTSFGRLPAIGTSL